MSALETRRARIVLVVLTAIWGSTFVVLQSGTKGLSPFVLIALRFVVAAVVLAAIRPSVLRRRDLYLRSLPLSISMLVGFALQTFGLSEAVLGASATTPARSAFLTSLSVVVVPVLDMFDTKRLPRWRLLGSAALAATGVAVLFWPLGGEWKLGDTLTLVSAWVFAWYIVELSRLSRGESAVDLAFAQFVDIAALAALPAILVAPQLTLDRTSLAALGYLGVVCTGLTFVLMTWGQARVPALEAAVIYTLEPVIAALFSVALGREPLAAKLVVGGAVIVAAMLLAGTDPSEPHPIAPPEGID